MPVPKTKESDVDKKLASEANLIKPKHFVLAWTKHAY